MSVFVVWLDETIIMNFTSFSDMIFTQRLRTEWHANQMRNITAQKSSKMYNMQKHLFYILYQMVPHTYACPRWVCCVWKSICFIKIQIHLHVASVDTWDCLFISSAKERIGRNTKHFHHHSKIAWNPILFGFQWIESITKLEFALKLW